MMWKSAVRGWSAAAVLAACVGSSAIADGPAAEIAASDVRVGITKAMEDLGFDLQEAHDFAVLATDGVDLQQENDVCMTYLVTLWWCASENGTEVMKMTRFRMDESCFGAFLGDGACASTACPPGTKRYYGVETGSGFCFGIPPTACVHMEVCGPVESTCASMPECGCLKLEGKTCEQVAQCVPVLGAPPTVAPADCPACN